MGGGAAGWSAFMGRSVWAAKPTKNGADACGHYRADRAMVVTTSRFTAQAVQLARSNKVELWDGERLEREVRRRGAERQSNVDPAPAPPHIDDATTCPKCGSAMVGRSGKYGQFWGCSNYPACRATRPRQRPASTRRSWHELPQVKFIQSAGSNTGAMGDHPHTAHSPATCQFALGRVVQSTSHSSRRKEP